MLYSLQTILTLVSSHRLFSLLVLVLLDRRSVLELFFGLLGRLAALGKPLSNQKLMFIFTRDKCSEDRRVVEETS